MTGAAVAVAVAIALGATAAALGVAWARARRAAAAQARQLGELRVQLERLERAHSDLLANLAHEIATPLASVRGYVETLRDGACAPDEAPRFLEVSLRNVERLERLVADVSTLSEAESGRLELAVRPVALQPAIDQVVSTLAPKARGKGVKLAGGETAAAALADPDRLAEVLINLVDNGVKFTAPGGSVDVSCRAHGARVAIEVRDTGCGIPRDALPRVTERFFRADRARARDGGAGGSGLGLALAKHLVERMGGSLEIASELDRGTQVTVWLAAAARP